MTNPTATHTWATYLDFDEVVDHIEMDEPPQGRDETKLQRYINAACTQAQNAANRPFAPTEFQERHDGWSGEYIQLRHSPFLSLVSCNEWQSTGGSVSLPESTPENPVDGIQIDYGTSRIMRTFSGYSWPRPFFPGSRNIEVTYMAGFDPVPDDVWLATADLVGYWWRNTQESPRWFDKGDQYGGDFTSSGLWPGVPNRISDVFAYYRIPVFG